MNKIGRSGWLFALIVLLLVACSGGGAKPPPDGKPGTFELSGVLNCTDGIYTVELSWTSAARATSYEVLRDDTSLVTSQTARSHSDTGPFTTGSSHVYVVRATNAQGSTDSDSWTISITECGTDEVPTEKPGAFELSGSVQCAEGVLDVQITWTASSGAASYQVHRDGTAQGGPLNTLSHTDPGPFMSGTSHEYVVRASNALGTTDSNTWTAEIPVCETEEPGPGPGLLEAVSVAIGRSHALAAMSDGRVLSWGTDKGGSLGHSDVAEDDVVDPRFIEGLEDIKSVDVGDGWSLALDGDGVVWSWGSNDDGQLGDGSTTDSYQPKPIATLSETIQAIAAGESFGLALTADGEVYAWGDNSLGQLGKGNEPGGESLSPILIDALSDVRQMAAGRGHALAVLEDGTVMTWGFNGSGQLGLGAHDLNIHTPAPVTALTGVVIDAVAAGSDHSVALQAGNGQLWTWGDNGSGQLGTGDGGFGKRRATPQSLPTLHAELVVAGADKTFALDEDGNWWVWGGNSRGELGDGSKLERHAPVLMAGDLDLTLAATGFMASVAVDADGKLYAWGDAVSGLVGIASSLAEPTPAPVLGLTDVLQVAGGNSHTLAVTEGGHVYAWGGNERGQLGLGDQAERLLPTRIESLTGATAVAAGYEHSLVLLGDGRLFAFGSNQFGQLGIGTDPADQLEPVHVTTLTGVSVITARNWHSLAVSAGGQVMAWGRNLSRQLGLGHTNSTFEPTRVGDLAGVTGLSTGGGHTLAIVPGGASAWGSGINGQLGHGSRGNGVYSAVPIDVLVLTDPTVISTGSSTSFAVQDGLLYTFGSNAWGELGDGNRPAEKENPTALGSLASVVDVQAGDQFALAQLADGTVYSWGNNHRGQLGGGTVTDAPGDTPGQILADRDVAGIFTGPESSFALLEDGSLLGWGLNGNGQLGNGRAFSYSTPQPVPFTP